MIIKLDGRNISDIKVLNEYIVLNHSNFEIELIQNSDEWLQISCEDFYISIARKENKLINYYSDIKQKELYEIINSYYHNPHGFVINQKRQNSKKKKTVHKKIIEKLIYRFFTKYSFIGNTKYSCRKK